MRLILILLGYQLLVVLGTADKNSMDPSIEPSMCILDQCEQANASAVGHDHSMFAKIGRGEILSYIGEGISTKAKGGHGSVGRGRGSHISPANCMAALNPLSLLHGQILLLTSVSTTARAHTPLAKSLVQSQDHGLVGKTRRSISSSALFFRSLIYSQRK